MSATQQPAPRPEKRFAAIPHWALAVDLVLGAASVAALTISIAMHSRVGAFSWAIVTAAMLVRLIRVVPQARNQYVLSEEGLGLERGGRREWFVAWDQYAGWLWDQRHQWLDGLVVRDERRAEYPVRLEAWPLVSGNLSGGAGKLQRGMVTPTGRYPEFLAALWEFAPGKGKGWQRTVGYADRLERDR